MTNENKNCNIIFYENAQKFAKDNSNDELIEFSIPCIKVMSITYCNKLPSKYWN